MTSRRPSRTRPGVSELPIPPLEMRELVGPTDPAAFDNPDGSYSYPYLEPANYETVFDFGCGCGRVARQLIQQRDRPRRYLGVDLHAGMVKWCQENLTPHAPQFEFVHHDVYNVGFNPDRSTPLTLPFPAAAAEFTMVNALSVFTHLTQPQAEFYLQESARILHPEGVIHSTWFLFEKAYVPMMHEYQNALYVNLRDPSNAVIFDREWLQMQARENGLTIHHVIPPAIRGFQWVVVMSPARRGLQPAVFPPDEAPLGIARPPRPKKAPHTIGMETELGAEASISRRTNAPTPVRGGTRGPGTSESRAASLSAQLSVRALLRLLPRAIIRALRKRLRRAS